MYALMSQCIPEEEKSLALTSLNIDFAVAQLSLTKLSFAI